MIVSLGRYFPIYILISVFVGIMPLREVALAEGWLNQVVHAQSRGEIAAVQRHEQDVAILKRACQIQLRKRAIPDACFELASTEPSALAQIKTERDLDWECVAAANGFTGTSFGKIDLLSPRCASTLIKKIEINAYKADVGRVFE